MKTWIAAAIILLGAVASNAHAIQSQQLSTLSSSVPSNPMGGIFLNPDQIFQEFATITLNHTFDQFDPALGNLTGVAVGYSQSATVTNLQSAIGCPFAQSGCSINRFDAVANNFVEIPVGPGTAIFSDIAQEVGNCANDSCVVTLADLNSILSDPPLLLTDPM